MLAFYSKLPLCRHGLGNSDLKSDTHHLTVSKIWAQKWFVGHFSSLKENYAENMKKIVEAV